MAAEEALRRARASAARPTEPTPAASDRRLRSAAGPHPSSRLRWRAAASTSRRRWASIEARGPKTLEHAPARGPDAAARHQRPQKETSVFDGLDTSLRGLGALAGLPAGALDAQSRAHGGRGAIRARGLPACCAIRPRWCRSWSVASRQRVPRAKRVAALAAPPDARADADFLLRIKEAQFEDALVRAAGVVTDVLADREGAAGGETLRATVSVFVPEGSPVVDRRDMRVVAPTGWTVARGGQPARRRDREPVRAPRPARRRPRAPRSRVTVSPDAAPHQPYWLATRARRTSSRGTCRPRCRRCHSRRPRSTGTVVAHDRRRAGDASRRARVSLRRQRARRDPSRLRRGAGGDAGLRRAAAHRADCQASRAAGRSPCGCRIRRCRRRAGTMRLHVPGGWKVQPARCAVDASARRRAPGRLVHRDAGRRPPARRLRRSRRGDGVDGSASHALAMRVIDYPHIQTHRIYEPARAPGARARREGGAGARGLRDGRGDQVPEAIRRHGPRRHADRRGSARVGDSRSSTSSSSASARPRDGPAFVASNGRLLQYVRDGGTLIVQYQQPDYVARGLVPFKAEMGRNVRVTDERAPVKLLQPKHPVFTFPNRIADEDWAGWVQERNLYAFATFGPEFTPLSRPPIPTSRRNAAARSTPARQGPVRLHVVSRGSASSRRRARAPIGCSRTSLSCRRRQ